MNWRNPILRSSLFAFRPTVYRTLKLLREHDSSSPGSLRQLHDATLASLLLHAWKNTEYYREILSDVGVIKDGTVYLENFENIPILTKEIIRNEGRRLRARELPKGRKAYLNRTGGSTGEPIEYWQDNVYWDVNVATRLYHFEMLGKELGEPELKIWGADRDIFLETGTISARAQNFLYNRRIRTCSHLTDSDIEQIVEEVNRFRPKMIWGYTDGMYSIAQYVLRKHLGFHPPAAVLVGGGTLLPKMSEEMQAAFNAPTINFYGSREMGHIASSCKELDGMHTSSYSHKVEVLSQAGRPIVGEDGSLILTSLHNYAMPFIRYSIGDRGRMSDGLCACGSGYPILESVSGREMESFLTKDGALISPIYLITSIGTLVNTDLIRKIQFIQESFSKVVVKIVISPQVAAEDLNEHLNLIRERLTRIMGEDCAVDFERVAEIPPTKSGKYLYTVSKLEKRDALSSLPDSEVA